MAVRCAPLHLRYPRRRGDGRNGSYGTIC
jgi:hypothetical protein